MSAQSSDTPILDLLGRMTADSMETSSLDEQTLMLVRVAALVAVDAPPASYLLNIGAAGEVGVTQRSGAGRPRRRRADRRHDARRRGGGQDGQGARRRGRAG